MSIRTHCEQFNETLSENCGIRWQWAVIEKTQIQHPKPDRMSIRNDCCHFDENLSENHGLRWRVAVIAKTQVNAI